ncbi:hypothetical protein L2E82_31693 [Cichorium intybus]|uniref:Uncharacterized protein n=1 Tax=Cichorium intybus TaxID=13427 RepID=A0ACB9BFY7_CICIN|nr:hypothetical protein L2E82_31693 [Cichorium intybus]
MKESLPDAPTAAIFIETSSKKSSKMAREIKEPCKKEACDIQACLSKNNFLPQRCIRVIQLLQSCCEQCENKSTHCGSVSGLLK